MPFPCLWQVLQEVVSIRAPKTGKPVLTLVPQDSLAEFWLPLTSFDYTRESKHGCGGIGKKKRITNQSFFCKIACLIDVFHPFQLWTLNIPEPCSLSGQRPVQEALQRVFDWLSQFCWKCGSQVSEDCSQQNYWLLYSWHSGWFPENINDDGGGMHRPWTWHSSLF